MNDKGLNLIKVQKNELLEKLLANRTNHVEEYEKAVEGYREAVIEELQGYLDDAIEGRRVKTHIIFDEPSCHKKDYDTVIEMLQMSVDDEICITMNEFRQYVQDQWNWKESFSMTNSKYLS
ncbi:MAG: hypothetical protein GWN01_04965 [Nitrosopumilaceae archaeon]|nr:hypothetical protein [Nitrosopumilaceae archaeon]NIU86699.1 hypothetical protein [Nitrosopumilaceae archaeon]NIV65396.1 hypothetical protein [Nitrosopumilaceae archaeon]NIX60896.1 hypothetical protein [Nitrosopumilaceae archaeon]